MAPPHAGAVIFVIDMASGPTEGTAIAAAAGPLEVTMNHSKSPMSKVYPVAIAASLVACGGSQPTQANTPQPMQPAQPMTQSAPTTSEEYGSAMGQPGYDAGPSMGMTTQETTPPGPSMDESRPSGPGTMNTQPAGGEMNPPRSVSQSGMGMMDVTGMNDAQIAAIVQALNASEIQEAQIAEAKATAPEVKRFAHGMLSSHREMLVKANALFTRMQIMPKDNQVSNQLKAQAMNEMSMLSQLRGHDFDRDYMAGQVRGHSEALELIDRSLSNIKNPDFRTALQADRVKVEGHLHDAESVQQTVMKGMTNMQPGSSDMGTPRTRRPANTPYVR